MAEKMVVDLAELQRLASAAKEAAPGNPWFYQEKADAYTHIVRVENPTLNNSMIVVQLSQQGFSRSETLGRHIAATNPDVVLALVDELELAHMRIKELDLLFGRYILAMRAAVIEEEHGRGAVAAMQWIYNSLAGPGELAPEGETNSQAYFDREIVAVDQGMSEVMEFHQQRRAAKAVMP